MQSADLQQHKIPVPVYHEWEMAMSIKPAVTWLLWVVGISLVAGLCFTTFTSFAIHPVGKYVFVFLFLLLGTRHLFILGSWLQFLSQGRKFLYTLVLVFLMVPVLYVLFSAKSYYITRLPVLAGCAFLLPFIFQASFYYFSGTRVVYEPFFIQGNEVPETKMSQLLLNSIPFTVYIMATATDTRYTQVPVIVNPRLPVALIFNRFFYHQQQRIRHTEQTGWRFYVKKWYGLKPLDPSTTLAGNKINPEDIVIAERVHYLSYRREHAIAYNER